MRKFAKNCALAATVLSISATLALAQTAPSGPAGKPPERCQQGAVYWPRRVKQTSTLLMPKRPTAARKPTSRNALHAMARRHAAVREEATWSAPWLYYMTATAAKLALS